MLHKMLVFVVCLGLPSLSHADAWQIMGPRALGMGGAFVAMAEGTLAQHWNPAGLAQEATNSKWGVAIPAGVRAEFTGGVLNDANTLGDLAAQFTAIQNAQTSGTAGAMDATKIASFYKALNAISGMNQPGKGALADLSGGLNTKIGKFAFSLNNYTSIGASPYVDTVNIGLGNGGAGITGVSYTGTDTTQGSMTAAEIAAANTIASAFSATTLANLNTLTGAALAGGGITTPAELGNALVNWARVNGQSDAQITDAATQISQNAGAVAPLIQSAASGNAYTNNQSNLTVRGASFTELAMGYGRQVLLPGLFVGGNLKAVLGKVGYARHNVLQNDSGSGKVLSNFRDNMATSLQPAIDLGVLWRADQLFPSVPFHPRAGLVGRNLNNPQFSQPTAAKTNGERGHYSENGQIRMGLAVTPLHFWNIAMDLDLTDNLTPVSGYHSRMFALGTEVNVFNRTWINIPLRAGLMKNIESSGSKLAYTAGFGINLLHFMLDIGGSISADQTQIRDGEKVPSSAAAAVQLGVMF